MTGPYRSIFTVQACGVSGLPATSTERYHTVCTPWPVTRSSPPSTQGPVLLLRLVSVRSTPEPPLSLAVKVRYTGEWCQRLSAPCTVVTGGVTSGGDGLGLGLGLVLGLGLG